MHATWHGMARITSVRYPFFLSILFFLFQFSGQATGHARASRWAHADSKTRQIPGTQVGTHMCIPICDYIGANQSDIFSIAITYILL